MLNYSITLFKSKFLLFDCFLDLDIFCNLDNFWLINFFDFIKSFLLSITLNLSILILLLLTLSYLEIDYCNSILIFNIKLSKLAISLKL